MKVNLESISETNGINFLSPTDKKIYCVGISTAGSAEIKMAQSDRMRHIIATTIDPKGAEYTMQRIKELGLLDQIEVKIENVSEPLTYPSCNFDYIYARLVLHYLDKDALALALSELYRVLRKQGKIFIVVRSIDCVETSDITARFDPATGLTTYSLAGKSYSRYFHSKESIKEALCLAGFSIVHMDVYKEQLCEDFYRLKLSRQKDALIEVLAEK
jgi:SAM-dependent methyltransferase